MNVPLSIYVVDHDPHLQHVLQPLAHAGIQLQTYRSRDQLATRVAREPLSCILLESRSIDPDELAMIQQLAATSHPIAIIVCVDEADVAGCVKAFRAGAADLLKKPLEEKELLDRVQVAIDRLRRQGQSTPREDPEVQRRVDSLTPREHDVLGLLAEGKVIKQVASELQISFQTAAKHRSRIHRKLRVSSDAELVRLLLTRCPSAATVAIPDKSSNGVSQSGSQSSTDSPSIPAQR